MNGDQSKSSPPLGAWMTQAAELAGVGFWRMDPATGDVEWSPNMFRIFEFPPGKAPRPEVTMGRIHPDDRTSSYADLSANLQEGGRVSVARIMLPSGGIRIVEGRTMAQRDSGGNVVAIIGSVLDITERVETERRLTRARELAEQVTSQQAIFAADLSHEIRTPLTAIIGYAHLLGKRSDLSPAAQRDVELIARSSRALLSIANNVLGRSRTAATVDETDLAPVAVRQIIDSVLDLFAEQAHDKGLKLAHAADETLPAYLDAHGDALTQILVNLVGNAVKFTDHGSVTVSTAFDPHFDTLSISVEDTGCGFDEATREALFQRFTRGGDEHLLPSGAGLGLSICKALVDALQGAISATSTPGAGSCFSITLHARPSEPSGLPATQAAGAADVLVVDDNPAIREIAFRLLESIGARVVAVGDGAAALQHALLQRFDLILVDLNLPDMPGSEIAAEIRARPGPNATSRLIAFTASDVDVKSLPPAFDGYLGKPIDPQRLAELVLGRRPPGAA
jgi:PAS domain S-box-containing protein